MSADEFLKVQRDIADASVQRRTHPKGWEPGVDTAKGVLTVEGGDTPPTDWADIGYNFLVAPDGVIYEGRGWGFRGAHARGYNHRSVGVAFIGDGTMPMPYPAQQSVLWLLSEAEGRFGTLRTVGHRDVGNTSCPGDAVYRWWSSEALRASQTPQNVTTPEPGEVSSQGISERLSPIPDLRDGWRRQMARRGWLRRR